MLMNGSQFYHSIIRIKLITTKGQKIPTETQKFCRKVSEENVEAIKTISYSLITFLNIQLSLFSDSAIFIIVIRWQDIKNKQVISKYPKITNFHQDSSIKVIKPIVS